MNDRCLACKNIIPVKNLGVILQHFLPGIYLKLPFQQKCLHVRIHMGMDPAENRGAFPKFTQILRVPCLWVTDNIAFVQDFSPGGNGSSHFLIFPVGYSQFSSIALFKEQISGSLPQFLHVAWQKRYPVFIFLMAVYKSHGLHNQNPPFFVLVIPSFY